MKIKHVVVNETQEQPPVNVIKWRLRDNGGEHLTLEANNGASWFTVLIINNSGTLYRCTNISTLGLELDDTYRIKVVDYDD